MTARRARLVLNYGKPCTTSSMTIPPSRMARFGMPFGAPTTRATTWCGICIRMVPITPIVIRTAATNAATFQKKAIVTTVSTPGPRAGLAAARMGCLVATCTTFSPPMAMSTKDAVTIPLAKCVRVQVLLPTRTDRNWVRASQTLVIRAPSSSLSTNTRATSPVPISTCARATMAKTPTGVAAA